MIEEQQTDLAKINDEAEVDNWSRFTALMTIGTALIYWLFFG